jgi:non-ribosomal peptide synthase protein (TIGR01720 family)
VRAEVGFNYLGQVGQGLGGELPLGLARGSAGQERSKPGRRVHLLEIGGGVLDGELELEFGYSERVHRRETVASLAEGYVAALGELIEHCQSPEAGGRSESDFADFGWTSQDLQSITRRLRRASR